MTDLLNPLLGLFLNLLLSLLLGLLLGPLLGLLVGLLVGLLTDLLFLMDKVEKVSIQAGTTTVCTQANFEIFEALLAKRGALLAVPSKIMC